MATILGLVWSMSILGFLYSDTLGLPPFVQPVRSCILPHRFRYLFQNFCVLFREKFILKHDDRYFMMYKIFYLKKLIVTFCRCCFMRCWRCSCSIPPRLFDTRRDSGRYAFWVASSVHRSFMWALQISGSQISSILFTQCFWTFSISSVSIFRTLLGPMLQVSN